MGEANSDDQLVDLSYIMELSGGNPDYIRQVLTIFMDNTAPGVKELERLVRTTDDWDKISKQAHFLKSSVGIVKVAGLHANFQQIELMAKEKRDRPVIEKLLDESVATFGKAEDIIRQKIKEAS